jgi:hypothetical protein
LATTGQPRPVALPASSFIVGYSPPHILAADAQMKQFFGQAAPSLPIYSKNIKSLPAG